MRQTMKQVILRGVTLATILMLGTTIAGAQMPATSMDRMPMDRAQMERMMADWPMASRDAMTFMTGKYGMPAAMTPDMAVWGRTGPWKRTIVYRAEHAHEFPAHHTDVMQQWVDYAAPLYQYDDLAMYDGSVVLERTSGEISARCDKEGANFLALNLADEIIHGKRSVADARRMYGEQIMAMKAMRPAPYTERIMFAMMAATGDPDHPASSDMMPGMMRTPR